MPTLTFWRRRGSAAIGADGTIAATAVAAAVRPACASHSRRSIRLPGSGSATFEPCWSARSPSRTTRTKRAKLANKGERYMVTSRG